MKTASFYTFLFLFVFSSFSQEKNYQLKINSKIMGDEVLSFNSTINIDKNGIISWEQEAGYYGSALLSAKIIGFDHVGNEMTVNFKYKREDFTETAGSLKVNLSTKKLIFKPPCLCFHDYEQQSGVYTFETIYQPGDPIVLNGEYVLTKSSTEDVANNLFKSGTTFTFENNEMRWETTVNNRLQQLAVRFVEVNTKDTVSVGKTICNNIEGSFIMGTDNIFYRLDSETNSLVRLDFAPTKKEMEKRQLKINEDIQTLQKMNDCVKRNALEEAAELNKQLHVARPLITSKLKRDLTEAYASKNVPLTQNELADFISSNGKQLKGYAVGSYPFFIDTNGNCSITTAQGKEKLKTKIRKSVLIGGLDIPVNATGTLKIDVVYEQLAKKEVVVHVNSDKPVAQKKNGDLYLVSVFTKGFFDSEVLSMKDQSVEKGTFTITETQKANTLINEIPVDSEIKDVVVKSGKLNKRIPKIILRSLGMAVCTGLLIVGYNFVQ